MAVTPNQLRLSAMQLTQITMVDLRGLPREKQPAVKRAFELQSEQHMKIAEQLLDAAQQLEANA